MTEILKLGVVGAGQMGHGIAQVAAISGIEVAMTDIAQQALDRAMGNIERSLAKLVKKERLTQDDSTRAQDRVDLRRAQPTMPTRSSSLAGSSAFFRRTSAK